MKKAFKVTQKSNPITSKNLHEIPFDVVKIADLEKVKNQIDSMKKDIYTQMEFKETELNNIRFEMTHLRNTLVDKADKTSVANINKRFLEFVPYLEFHAMGKSLGNYCSTEAHKLLQEDVERVKQGLGQYELISQVDNKIKKLQEEIANKLTFYTFKEDFAQKDRYLQEKFMKINVDITRNEQALIDINSIKLPAIIQVMDEKIDMKDLNLELGRLNSRLDQFAIKNEVNTIRNELEAFQ
ncbi:unnamed protein product [Moneuplotes crassus]|uniref:Uncharacterized protein n=1 Tax=Euplotes crassus TaxID=5936 RepID=A0AAD1XAF2_EUPCR|nr:unnamed protein product [Moneuplotes crassus]